MALPLFVFCGFLGLASTAYGQGVVVEGIRHSSGAERTRVVIDLSSPASFEHRVLTDPDRILVAMEGARFADGVGDLAVRGGYVSRIRTNTLRDGRIQIVLDLARTLSYQAFTLGDPPRIVVDVAHEGERATPPPPAAKPDPDPAPPDPPAKEPAETSSKPEAESAGKAEEAAPPKAAAPQVSAPQTVIPAEPPRHGNWIIAVDAGHGGDDPGSSHHGAREKEIALALAVEVHKELNRRTGIEAFLVRKGDYFIPLRKRRSIAEEKGAHLFVSIHCDGLERPDVRGTSVYFLSLNAASDEASRLLAERENKVDEDMGVAPAGEDLDEILFNMAQTDVLAKSEMLGELVLGSLLGLGTVYDRGVKQAGFAVLKSPSVPSILVEAAFISNPEENRLLRDVKWQKRFARHLADGIEAYCRSVEGAD